MLVYLFATIVGGLLLGASVVSGHHGDSGGGHVDAGHVDSGESHAGHGGSVASLMFSVRFWTYLLAFGGATGLLLHFLAGTGEPLTALLAAGVGATSGGTAQMIVSRLGGQIGGTVQSEELVGKTGLLLLPAGKGKSGQVRLTVKNQAVDLIATTDDPELAAREEVLVVEVRDGVAHVTRSPVKGEEVKS